jgi:hypothetical protein
LLLLAALAGTRSQAADHSPFPPDPAALAFFEKSVRPVLVERCHECHSADAGQPRGGLRLDSLDGMLRGGRSGSVIVPGKPEQSLLVLVITHDPTVAAMPPKGKLRPEQLQALRRWIQLGAPWPEARLGPGVVSPKAPSTSPLSEEARSFWAFQPPKEPPVPPVRNRHWPSNPIDHFVLARLEAEGLTPAPPADRRTLIRRATFDLHGLPPTPDEVEAFVADDSPDAWERLIDRLLASPRYGERWGRHWLDVARYADTNGMDDNIAWADAWRYRDHVIAAFNRDKPYDQFVREQVAGDLLTHWGDPNRAEAVIATGFLMVGAKMPSADDPVKQQLDIVDEQLDTTARAFLGLTMGCARCHDHKYDPLPMSDYYALAGIFLSTKTMLSYRVDAKFNLVALDGPAQQEQLTRLENEMDRHDDALVNGNRLKMTDAQRKQHESGLKEVFDAMKARATAMAVEDGPGNDLHVLLRGNHLTPGPRAPRGVPGVLSGSRPLRMPTAESGRRELAEWLTRLDNPLTVRVMVNRLWLGHFGQGIVRSPDNFGRLGERPDNQALLDWLAVQFVKSGWSIKAMHRRIMTSRTYRMSGRTTADASLKDPENRLWGRFPRQRMSAEVLRDSLLAVSGRLDGTMGGRLLPFDNHKILSAEEVARANELFERPRRTVYLPVIRSGLNDLLQTFDFPDPSAPSGRRDTTTVAPQALFLMNSPLMTGSARQLAARLLAVPGDDRGRIAAAYRRVLQRRPSDEEVLEWQQFLDDQARAEARMNPKEADPRRGAWEGLCRVLLSANEFVYID